VPEALKKLRAGLHPDPHNNEWKERISFVYRFVCGRFHNKPKAVSFGNEDHFSWIHDFIRRIGRIEFAMKEYSPRISSS